MSLSSAYLSKSITLSITKLTQIHVQSDVGQVSEELLNSSFRDCFLELWVDEMPQFKLLVFHGVVAAQQEAELRHVGEGVSAFFEEETFVFVDNC